MLLTLIILALLIVTEISFSYKKRITWIFVLYFAGISLLFATSVMSLIKFTSYHYINALDYYLYFSLKKLSVNVLNLARFNNIGLAIIMFAAILMYSLLSHKKRRITTGILSLPIVLFLVINDPNITYRLFLLKYSFEPQHQLFMLADSYIHIYSLSIFIGYMFIPFLALLSYCRKTKLRLLHENATIAGSCLVLIDVFLVYNFIFGMLSYVMPWKVDLNKFPLYAISYDSHLFTIPITILMGIVIIILSIRYKPIGAVQILTRRKTNQQFYALNHNLRMIFHINKNVLYTVEKLAAQSLALHEKNPSLALENIRHIESTASKGLKTITQMLSMLDDVHVEKTPVSLRQCIENARAAINIPPSIVFEEHYLCDDITVRASEVHITEVFTNLFRNAVETIQMKNSETGHINVTLSSENGLAVIEVLDDGSGIKKSDISQIFSVLYSTKHNSKNWGIGLSYVKKVIDIYNGYIYVKSKPGEYACFQVILPIGKEDI